MKVRLWNLRIVTCAAILCFTPALLLCGQNDRNNAALLPKSESPDKTLGLSLRKNDQQKIVGLCLISLKGNSVAVSFPLSDAVRSWSVQQIQFSSIIWTDNSSAVALMIGDGKNGEAFACARLANGTFKAVNLTSLSKGAHLGVMGKAAADFVRSEHTPVKWGNWTAQHGRVIEIRSRFWDRRNRRYTVTSPFMISNNGELGGQ